MWGESDHPASGRCVNILNSLPMGRKIFGESCPGLSAGSEGIDRLMVTEKIVYTEKNRFGLFLGDFNNTNSQQEVPFHWKNLPWFISGRF